MAVGVELARLMMEQSVGDQAEQVPAEPLDSGARWRLWPARTPWPRRHRLARSSGDTREVI